MAERSIRCPKCPAMFWTERARDNHLDQVDHEAKTDEWAKVSVRRNLLEQVKVRAAADNRNATNYIENLILKDLAPKPQADGGEK